MAHGGEMNTSIPCYGIIPARYDSSRFPGKPLADIWGRPMFWHVYAHAKRALVLRNIVLATDDERIAEAALESERDSISIEISQEYFEEGKKRIENVKKGKVR